ncbi:MAG: DUF692 domain-containing protein [Planctomycetota bacterium]
MRIRDLVQQDLGIGVGLRAPHYDHVLDRRPQVDWFELLSENHMHTGGRPLRLLDEVSARYPVALHGVAMNVGGTDPLDRAYLRELRDLQRRSRARWVSDHLCWTRAGRHRLHDLLPLPYTRAALRHVIARVHQAQDLLELPLVLENPSTYLGFAGAELDEPTFLRELVHATGCGLLVDVNNVAVSAHNHGTDAAAWLRAMPWDHVVHFHLAGHADHGTHRIDTHDRPVSREVWDLYALAWRLSGGRSTLLEWDANVPAFDVLHREAKRARREREREEPVKAAS